MFGAKANSLLVLNKWKNIPKSWLTLKKFPYKIKKNNSKFLIKHFSFCPQSVIYILKHQNRNHTMDL